MRILTMKLRCIFLLGIFLLISSITHAGEKTDIVILKNGDHLTGEFKNLESGILEFKTDTMGTVNIEWRFISELISSKNLSVLNMDGNRWLGNLQKPEISDHIVVNTEQGAIDLTQSEIVGMWPVAATFLDKMDLSASLGFGYSKSTDITDFDLSIDFAHRSEERLNEASLRSNITRQQDGNDQNRQDLRFSQQYLRPNRRFRTWSLGAESNEALGVNLRLSGGGAIGKYFAKTNDRVFYLSGGLLVTQEFAEGGTDEANLEAQGTARYRFFRYASPKRSFDTTISIFPSITVVGRVRFDLRSTFKLEFYTDLFWSMEFYATGDNEPLSGNEVEKFDYGITTALGWSY